MPQGLNRIRRPSIALIAAVGLVVSVVSVASAEPAAVTTTSSAGETTFEVTQDGCAARLVRRHGEPILVYRNDCRETLETRAEVFARLVMAALPTAADRDAGAPVLVPSVETAFPDFARRLAQAAARSTEWYGERAKRDPRFGNALVVKIANTPPVYRELQEALRQQGLKVRLAAVDNVRIAVAPETPFADWLADRGVSAREQLPYDADVTFRISQ